MDISKELAIDPRLTGVSQELRDRHDKAVSDLREALTKYSQHCEALEQPSFPVDDIVLIIAAALGKDRLPELVDALASASYKLEASLLALKLEDLAHDTYIKQPRNVKDQLAVVSEELKLTPYGISQKITGEANPTSPQRRRVEVRWQRWLSGEGLKTLTDLEADLNALGYELVISPR